MKVSDLGPRDAKIMLVGDFPSSIESSQGMMFSNAHGGVLKGMLKNAGIDFTSCYSTCVMHEQPPKGDMRLMYLDKKCQQPNSQLQVAWDILLETIERIKPNIVILLGREPLKAVLNKNSITAWRGSLCMYRDIKCMPTYNPKSVSKIYENKAIVEMDLTKAKRESMYPEDKRCMPNILACPTFEKAVEWFEHLFADQPERVSFDLETTYETLTIRSIGFAARYKNKTKSIAIPLMRSGVANSYADTGSNIIKLPQGSSCSSYYNVTQELRLLNYVDRLLKDENIQKVGQNSIAFDQPILEEQLGMRIHNHYMDTMHAHHTCYLELPKSLDFMTTFYTEWSNYWSDKVTSDDESNCVYNAWDCCVTLEASYKLEEELKNLGMYDLYFNHVHPLSFALTRCSNYGIEYDSNQATELFKEYKKEMDEITEWVSAKAGKPINIDSPKQLKELLYDKEKFPTQYSKDKSVTTDAEALRKLVKRYPHEELLQKILRYRQIAKLSGTYLSIRLDDDGIMRASFNASGTNTGRISSSATLRGTGGNLQNIPYAVRKLYRARKGHSILKCDLAQAETLVVAELLAKHGDNTLVEKYEQPEFDIHRWGGHGIFEVPESSITKEQRAIGKLGNHSGNYQAGPQVLVSQSIKRDIKFNGQLGISYQLSKKILEQRHKQLPGLRKWWKGIEQQIKHTRIITTCFGRKRLFFGRIDNTLLRAATAFEPQSTIGDLANTIFRILDAILPSDCHLIIQVHDEVDIECPDDKIDYVASLVKEVAEIPLYVCPDRPPRYIPIDIEVGKDWLNVKEYNPTC